MKFVKMMLLASALIGFASCASKKQEMQTTPTDYGTSTSSK